MRSGKVLGCSAQNLQPGPECPKVGPTSFRFSAILGGLGAARSFSSRRRLKFFRTPLEHPTQRWAVCLLFHRALRGDPHIPTGDP